MNTFNPLKDLYTHRPLILLLGVNIIFFTLIITLMPFCFELCDDRLMAWTASGYFTGMPDYHTLFMNVIYSWVEAKLYTILPNVEWYTWLFLGIHLLSFSIIVHRLYRSDNHIIAKIASLLLAYIIELHLLTNLTFTTTAGLAATAGMILVVAERKYWLGCLLFLLASLVRYESAMFCGLMIAALFPLLLLRRKFNNKPFIALCICAIGAFSLHLVDKKIYESDPYWNTIYEYNKLRGKVYDNSNTWRLLTDSTGVVDKNELDTWTGDYHDMERFPEEKLKAYLSVIESQTIWHGIPGLKKIKNIPTELSPFWPLFLICFLVYLGIFFSCANRREKLSLLFAFLCFPLILAIIALNTRLCLRAVLCGWMPLLFLPTLIIPVTKPKTSLLFLIATGIAIPFFISRITSTNPYSQRQLFEQQKELVEAGRAIGINCFIIDYYVNCDYPFGIRISTRPEITIIPPHDISTGMICNNRTALLLRRDSIKSIMNSNRIQYEKQNNQNHQFHCIAERRDCCLLILSVY